MALGAVALGVGGFYGYRALNGPSSDRSQVAQPASATREGTPRPEGSASQLSVEPIADKVSVVVDSTPAGAQVFVGGEKQPRGATPLTVELDRGDAPVELVLRADGHADKTATVVPSENRALDLVLMAKQDAEAADDGDDGEVEKKAASADRERKVRSRSRERSRRSRKESSRERRSSESKSDRGEKSDGKDEERTKVGDDILRPEL
jgi:hypothetical protein